MFFNLFMEASACLKSLKLVLTWLIGSISINIAAKKLLNSSLVRRPRLILAAPKPNIASIPKASTKPTTGC